MVVRDLETRPARASAGSLIAIRAGCSLRHSRIATITFTSDDGELVTRLERFGDTITRIPWWRTVTEGYCAREGDCIGDGQPGIPVRLDEAPPVDVHVVRWRSS